MIGVKDSSLPFLKTSHFFTTKLNFYFGLSHKDSQVQSISSPVLWTCSHRFVQDSSTFNHLATKIISAAGCSVLQHVQVKIQKLGPSERPECQTASVWDDFISVVTECVSTENPVSRTRPYTRRTTHQMFIFRSTIFILNERILLGFITWGKVMKKEHFDMTFQKILLLATSPENSGDESSQLFKKRAFNVKVLFNTGRFVPLSDKLPSLSHLWSAAGK